MSAKNRNPVDAHVGGRVKLRRGIVGLSQTKLGDELGITFQQVQKYEKGINRIGASRLYHISQILGVPVQYFFEGLETLEDGTTIPMSPDVFDEFMQSPMGIALCRSFVQIGDPEVQRRVFKLIQSMGEGSN
jgi:transcriptional regulator with XRE-family HTH domain